MSEVKWVNEQELKVITWIKMCLWMNKKHQNWLAQEIGMEASSFNNYMNGTVRISLPVLIKIIDVLNPSDETLGEILKRGE